MKRSILIALVCGFALSGFGQSPVLIDIAGDQITVEEFNMVYNKNNSSAQAIDPKTKEEYLDMYINFKLKVKEAEELGMDTVPNFVRELSGYRKQLAAPYLTDQNVTEELIKEAYDRKQYDVNAWHILIGVKEDAAPKDTFDAWIECQKIKRDLTDPKKQFAAVAVEKSQDPSAQKNMGDLGYFNVFQMVYPFETAAYTTPVGEVSEPIRTRFGYHLVYVNDKRPARGEIHVAHIMVNDKGDDNADSKKKEQKINEIYDQLEQGANFEALAKQYSDDRGTSSNGGVLPWFGTGRMVPNFEDAAFGLEKDGDYSKPIKTRFGWHIIKRLEKKEMPAYEDIKAELKNKVTRDGRGNKSKEAFYSRIKQEYGYKEYPKAIENLATYIDKDFALRKWKVNEKFTAKAKPVFALNDKTYKKEKASYSQWDLGLYMEGDKRYQRMPLADSLVIVNSSFEAFVNKTLVEFENARLEAKYPKFNALMQEYHDGILLFDLMDDKVWSKAIKDSTGLEDFYEKNKENYKWDKRSQAYIISCADALIAQTARSMIEAQGDSVNMDSIVNMLNADSQLAISVKTNKYSRGDNELVDQYGWTKGISSFINQDGRWVFVFVEEILEPQPKELNETRGAVVSDYQDQLEKSWIEELRKKYPVTVYKEVLN